LESSVERFKTEYGVPAVVTINNPLSKELDIPANVEVFESLIGRLLINAWEAYPKNEASESRDIWIETKMEDTADTHMLHIMVHDDGQGIDPQIREDIFEPFITSKTSVGRGLGLTMVRHTIRNLRGDLKVEEKEEGGVVATLLYPIPRPTDDHVQDRSHKALHEPASI
jgi:two-component system sensor histidine kinase/response regulator